MIIVNPLAARTAKYAAAAAEVVAIKTARTAMEFFSGCSLYSETPLRAFDVLAGRLNVARIFVKDETSRLSLTSFKALGGSYAILRKACAPQKEGRIDSRRDETFVTATDGNHGISVAAGAKIAGRRSVCFLPSHVDHLYEGTMRALGADVIRVDGNYDEAVVAALRAAKENDWTLISDTTDAAFDEVTHNIMAGYGVLAEECVEQLQDAGYGMADKKITHVFIQGGVGGLAAAVAGRLWENFGENRPTIVIVEPKSADCLFQSALRGTIWKSSGDLVTTMGGLSCGRPSRMAWTILATTADFFMTIDEATAAAGVVAVTSDPAAPDRETTPSGAAGIAGLIEAALDSRTRAEIGLDDRSVVLCVCTESIPDPKGVEPILALTRNRERMRA